MENIPEAGFHWRAEADGTILYRANEDSHTYVISRGELARITNAGEVVAAALFASIVFTFAFNGHWWLTGFRTPEFAALLVAITVIPAALIGRYAWLRHGILARAQRASRDIEVYALTESIRLGVQFVTRHVSSFWLWLGNAALLFLAFEIGIASVRFLRTPVADYLGSHRPGPLDGVFYMGFVLFFVYLLTDELMRRRKPVPVGGKA